MGIGGSFTRSSKEAGTYEYNWPHISTCFWRHNFHACSTHSWSCA